MSVNTEFWRGRSVLVVGHSGFKGGWISTWLTMVGAKVSGYALAPEGKDNMFEAISLSDHLVSNDFADITDIEALRRTLQKTQPEVIFHLTAVSWVGRAYANPAGTFMTNVMGTVNLLEAVRSSESVKAVVVITSDKCYEIDPSTMEYSEADRLGGYDPYASSKACVEILTASWRRSWFSDTENEMDIQSHSAGIATARAGNVIGGGDWAGGRLVPDMVRAKYAGADFNVRYPDSIRPWQHVLEPVAGYIQLAQNLLKNKSEFDEAWNFGPNIESCKSVRHVVEGLSRNFSMQFDLESGDSSNVLHETKILRLNIEKAKSRLNWQPVFTLEQALNETTNWYDSYYSGGNMFEITLSQIKDYQKAAKMI
jgi:CDP-glucose 4,6-dehydratase